MASDDDSVFSLDDFGGPSEGASDSDFDMPVSRAKPKAKATTKAAAKPKAAPKKTTTTKSTATKAKAPAKSKDSASSSLKQTSLTSFATKASKRTHDDSEASDGPDAPFGSDDLDDSPVSKKPKVSSDGSKKPVNNSEKYQELDHVQHIIKRPDTYIGSVEMTTRPMWVFNSESQSMQRRDVSFVPGLYKIFDEILVNAADNKQNDANMDEIRVVIDRESGMISVWNNGRGIPIEIHAKKKIYIPEMIFGHLLTSSNYDDDQQKITGGRNGFGAKLCNIFSTEFIVETADSSQRKKYKQTWTANMSIKGNPKITDQKGGEDWTKVTFKPDYSKFKMEGMDDDFEALVKRRIYDMAAALAGVKVKLNGERIKITKFAQYIKMYTSAIAAESGPVADDKKTEILHDRPHPRWEIGFAVSDGSFQQVSFVNSIATTSGGTHVNYIADQVVTRILEKLKKDKKSVQLKPHQIKNHLFLFVNCQIVNPSFTSQTKEQLTTLPSQFGSKPVVSDKFLNDIMKTSVMENIRDFAMRKADQLLAKSDGGGRRRRMHNAKLTDANKAGTKEGWKCTLILTEGDSASGLALAGRAVVSPDYIGVFPLRGKMLNVRDASVDQITKNAEIQNIKQFMGLQHKKDYTDTKSLRYGHLMIMTDQDHDGSHIKGLLINFLEAQFPSLLKIPDFLQFFITPIVKVWKGDAKRPKQLKSFFTMPEYNAWKVEPGHQKGWDHKYYKGLGTNNNEDAQVYFQDLDRHLKEFETIQEGEPEIIDLAFSKKKADARKNWLRQYVPGTYLDLTARKITYADFVNKELILFSIADNERSIPSVVDGLKLSQRKALYTCFRRNLRKDVKVVDLAGSASGLTNYSYGESSMQQTIVGLAQTFVGSNNVNLLEPSGNFGSRRMGGQDAASPRYIYTRLSPFARRIFHSADDALLQYHEDDGKTIEPVSYVPVLPLILINGADGIGTGWSTSIPNYNPIEIVDNLKRRMEGSGKSDMKMMMPWFRGFAGDVIDLGGDRYKFTGIATVTGDNTIEVTELPIRMWTQDFKDKLEEIIAGEKSAPFIKDYHEYNTPTTVHFVIQLDEKLGPQIIEAGLEDKFKLSKTLATSNLVAFDSQGRINRYETVLDILEEFYLIRLDFYGKRKQHLLDKLQLDLDILSNQVRFIRMVIDGELIVSKKKRMALVLELKSLKFRPVQKKPDTRKAVDVGDEPSAGAEDEDDDEDKESGVDVRASDYDYLLGLPLWSLTEERINRLKNELGQKESEIDALIGRQPKELWAEDLDLFVEQWERELEEDRQARKKASSSNRRGSLKLGITGKGTRKKKKADSEDDDYEAPKKRVTKKPAVKAEPGAKVKAETKRAGSKAPSVEPESGAGASSSAAAAKRGNALSRVKEEEGSDDDMMDMIAAVEKVNPRARTTRAAAAKPKYVVSSEDDDNDDDDDGDGDDILDDIDDIVAMRADPGAGASSTISELSEPKAVSPTTETVSGSTKPAVAETKKKSGLLGLLDEDLDDSLDDILMDSPVKKLLSKAAPPKPVTSTLASTLKAQASAAKEKPTKAAAAKTTTTKASAQPAAKAAAAAKPKPAPASRRKAMVLDDEDRELLSDMDMDELDAPPPPRPTTTKGKAKPAAAVDVYAIPSDDDDDGEDNDESIIPVGRQRISTSTRGKAAAAKPTKAAEAPKKKAAPAKAPAKGRGRAKAVIDDDDDDDDDDDGDDDVVDVGDADDSLASLGSLLGDPAPPTKRAPRRAAAAAASKKYVISDDESVEELTDSD